MFGVDHYAISVKDVYRSVEFYKNLEFAVVKKWDAADSSLSIVHMKNGDFILELFCYKAYKEMPDTALSLNEDLPVIGSKHMGLYADDLENVQKILLKKGVIETPIEIKSGRLGRKYFFISDPNGILIEIIEKKGR